MNALKAADPARGLAVPYDERAEQTLSAIVAGQRPAPRQSRRRSFLVAGLLTLLLPVAGGAALAGGGLSEVQRAFFWETPHHPSERLQLGKAVLVHSEPGPDGTTFDVWVAKSADRRCVTAVFEPEGSTGVALDGARGEGGNCTSWPPESGAFTDGGGGFQGGGEHSSLWFAYASGAAVRAEVRLADGTVRPVGVGQGWTAGWLPLNEVLPGTTLTGFARDGTVVGTVRLYGSPAS